MHTPPPLFFLAFAAIVFAWPGVTCAAPTWDNPEDRFVARQGPQDRDIAGRGRLGIVLPSYGRKSLYEAYRVLNLPAGALVKEDRSSHVTPPPLAPDPLKAWLALRAEVVSEPLVRPIDYYKDFSPDVLGGFGNCGPSAFTLAMHTLQGLRRAPGFGAEHVRT